MIIFKSDGVIIKRQAETQVIPSGAVATDGDEQFCAGHENAEILGFVFDEGALIQANSSFFNFRTFLCLLGVDLASPVESLQS